LTPQLYEELPRALISVCWLVLLICRDYLLDCASLGRPTVRFTTVHEEFRLLSQQTFTGPLETVAPAKHRRFVGVADESESVFKYPREFAPTFG
jgi:hypothetical protein